MKQLVRLFTRPSSDGKSFTYVLRYLDACGKRRWESLGHSDSRRAEKERQKKEKLLIMGYVEPGSMRLNEFLDDSIQKTGNQIRESTRYETEFAMKNFIATIGNMDFRKVSIDHAEYYRQVCLDAGESPATVAKKLRHLKRVFQLAVKRRQIDENPLQYIDMPKIPKVKVRIYSPDERDRLLKASVDYASEIDMERNLKWDLLILVALSTAMRRGELLNLVWSDVDFEDQTITVFSKDDTKHTWKWLIKDSDHRVLPLTSEITQLLVEHQESQSEGYPYVFVPSKRYDYVQKILRPSGKWSLSNSRTSLINNFYKQFGTIRKRANVKKGTFHDLRRTALSNWFANGMNEYDVMVLAGHSNFDTTHQFYLAVASDLVARARRVQANVLSQNLVHFGAVGVLPGKEKRPAIVNNCQPKGYKHARRDSNP
jgi:integrase